MLNNAVYIIHETKDYDKFRIDPTNRPIDYGHLQRLKESIRRRNLLAEFPIIVDPEMNVMDGQTRLHAARDLGVSVFYIVSVSLQRRDVPLISDMVWKWTLEDTLHSYVAKGYVDYEALRKFKNEFPDIHLSDALTLCYRNGDGTVMSKWGKELKESFVEGNYTCGNIDFGRKVANALMDFKTYFSPYHCQRVFVYAVAHLIADPRYDHDRMMRKMRYLSAWLRPCVKTSDYFPMLNKIYNYKVRDGEEVEFTFRESKKAKQPA